MENWRFVLIWETPNYLPYLPNWPGEEQLLGIVGSAYLHYNKHSSSQSISYTFGLWKRNMECCWNDLWTVKVPWMRWAVLSMCCRAMFDSDKYCLFIFPSIRQTCVSLLFWKSICIFFHSFDISNHILYSCSATSEFQSAVKFHDFTRTA